MLYEVITSNAHAAPCGLSVIPAETGEPLRKDVSGQHHIWVLQHGWAHRNHAEKGRITSYNVCYTKLLRLLPVRARLPPAVQVADGDEPARERAARLAKRPPHTAAERRGVAHRLARRNNFV